MAKSDKKKSSKSKYYIDPNYLDNLVTDYQTNPEDQSNRQKMGDAILLIAENVWKIYDFGNSDQHDQAISDCCYFCLRSVFKIDLQKGGSFSYLTQSCIFAIIQTLKKEYRYRKRFKFIDPEHLGDKFEAQKFLREDYHD